MKIHNNRCSMERDAEGGATLVAFQLTTNRNKT